jgi:hypothetical protein
MDETEFREVYNSVNDQRCVFEKAVLTRMFACEKLIKVNIAEREAAGCTDRATQQQCGNLLELLRGNAAFALKLTHVSGPLPHAKELKVQCGGLTGLREIVAPAEAGQAGVQNIHGLIQAAKAQFGNLADLPYREIIKSVSMFEGRRKRRHRD